MINAGQDPDGAYAGAGSDALTDLFKMNGHTESTAGTIAPGNEDEYDDDPAVTELERSHSPAADPWRNGPNGTA
jgi:hypothetical protein